MRITAFMLVLTAVISFVPIMRVMAETSGGVCGDNLSWTFDNGILTISGTGNMYDWSEATTAPWYADKDKISGVVLENGVSSIGNYAFLDCAKLAGIVIPDSVSLIRTNAFLGCGELADVYFTGTSEQWSALAVSGGNDILASAAIQYNQSNSSPIRVTDNYSGKLTAAKSQYGNIVAITVTAEDNKNIDAENIMAVAGQFEDDIFKDAVMLAPTSDGQSAVFTGALNGNTHSLFVWDTTNGALRPITYKE